MIGGYYGRSTPDILPLMFVIPLVCVKFIACG